MPQTKKNIIELKLYGTRALVQNKLEKTYEIPTKRDPKTKNVVELKEGRKLIDTKFIEQLAYFPLRKVTIKELAELRASGIPGFVLKDSGKFYYTAIPKKLNLITTNVLKKHNCGENCSRLSPAADEDGGCAKIRDRFEKHIEKYDFIIQGYETFNCNRESLVVSKCAHYETKKHQRLSPIQRRNLLVALAQYVWEGATDLHTVRELVSKNEQNF